MTKDGYQPIKTKLTTKIIPPNTGSNVQMKKSGYTWKDLDKAWWEGFDTCKAKAGETNIKLNDELEKLKKQLEELPDKWCRNKDDYCPHLAKLEKENAELKNERNAFKIYSDGAELDAINLNEQLTKAKDHIKKLLGCLQQDTNDSQTNYYVVQYMTEAEQFLDSKVEK